MSRQILFCVESNNKARTDYQYIEETLKRFYKVDRKIRYRAIYLGSKTKYNAKDKVREINKNIKTFIGEIIFQERRYQEKPIFQGLQKLRNAVRCAGIYIECNTYAAGMQQRY